MIWWLFASWEWREYGYILKLLVVVTYIISSQATRLFSSPLRILFVCSFYDYFFWLFRHRARSAGAARVVSFLVLVEFSVPVVPRLWL